MGLKALHGLVQAAREDCGLTIVLIHVEDCYVIGSEENMDKLVEKLTEAGLKVKVEKETKEYLGCEIIMSKYNTQAWLGQIFIAKKMLTRFADVIGTSKIQYKTSGTPGFNIRILPVSKEGRSKGVLCRCWYTIVSD
jgi:NAD(P)H-flavin reductase